VPRPLLEDPASDPASRAELGFEWQMRLPGGGDAVSWGVEVDIDLLLERDDEKLKADVPAIMARFRRAMRRRI
jgi:hypothetical protein